MILWRGYPPNNIQSSTYLGRIWLSCNYSALRLIIFSDHMLLLNMQTWERKWPLYRVRNIKNSWYSCKPAVAFAMQRDTRPLEQHYFSSGCKSSRLASLKKCPLTGGNFVGLWCFLPESRRNRGSRDTPTHDLSQTKCMDTRRVTEETYWGDKYIFISNFILLGHCWA